MDSAPLTPDRETAGAAGRVPEPPLPGRVPSSRAPTLTRAALNPAPGPTGQSALVLGSSPIPGRDTRPSSSLPQSIRADHRSWGWGVGELTVISAPASEMDRGLGKNGSAPQACAHPRAGPSLHSECRETRPCKCQPVQTASPRWPFMPACQGWGPPPQFLAALPASQPQHDRHTDEGQR